MGIRQRRGGLIPRGLHWARRLAGGAPTGSASPAPPPAVPPGPSKPDGAPSDPAPELSDRLDLARRRLKDSIPPREP